MPPRQVWHSPVPRGSAGRLDLTYLDADTGKVERSSLPICRLTTPN